MNSLYFVLVSLLLCVYPLPSTDGAVGVNYGGTGLSTNPVSLMKAVGKMRRKGIKAVKIYSPDPTTLTALRGMQVMNALPNSDMPAVAASLQVAQAWVDTHVVPYLPRTNITAIAVGNEVYNPSYADPAVVLAMRNIHSALKARHLDMSIKVVTPCQMTIFQNTYPPSASSFVGPVQSEVRQLLQFLTDTGSYFVANVYPFFPLLTSSINLNFTTFQGTHGFYDHGRYYQNLFDAMLDSVVWATEKFGFPQLPITVGEIGWPTDGAPGLASPSLAQLFNSHLVGKVSSNQGTPKRPGASIPIYLFELFDQDQKDTNPGLFELHWGVYNMHGSAKYQFSFTVGPTPPLAPPPMWCVLKSGATMGAMYGAINYACTTGGVDCSFIKPGGQCYGGGSLEFRATAVIDTYYQKFDHAANTCDFDGAAYISYVDPSVGSCRLPGYPPQAS